MRLNYRLLLFGVIAAAFVTHFASAATAQTLELRNAGNNAHCPAISTFSHSISGGCVVRAISEGHVEFAGHFLGIEIHRTDCNNQFTARLDEDGLGYLTNQQLTGAECTREPCKEANGTVMPWRVEGNEVIPGERLEVQFCVQAIGGGSVDQCHIAVPFEEIGTTNQYEFYADDLNGEDASIRCELTGHWATNTALGTVIDIQHLN